MMDSGETWQSFAASNVVKTDFSRIDLALNYF
jgi:hypothetical protein